MPLAQPAVGRNFVYVVSKRGVVSRLDAETGLRSWTFRAGVGTGGDERFWWRPTLAGRVLYIAGIVPHGAVLYALRANDGKLLWRHLWPRQVARSGGGVSEPAVVDGRVLVATSFNPSGHPAIVPGVWAFQLGHR